MSEQFALTEIFALQLFLHVDPVGRSEEVVHQHEHVALGKRKEIIRKIE